MLVALAGLLFPMASFAQSEAAATDAHTELAAVLTSSELVALQTDALLAALRAEMAADPDVADLEAECPGGMDKMMALLSEITLRDQPAETAAYRVELADLFRAEMPADQAAEAAEFYRSEIGQKVLMATSRNRSFSSMARAALQSDSGMVGQEAFAADSIETRAMVTNELRAELFAASIDLSGREWLNTLARLRPQMQNLSLQYLNAELTPEEDEELEAGFDEVLTAHIDECYE